MRILGGLYPCPARHPRRMGVGLGAALAVCMLAFPEASSAATPSVRANALRAHGQIVNGLSREYAGQTIHLLFPPWLNIPQSYLTKFTNLTGIKVSLESLAFDDIHDKVGTAEAAGTAPADLTEVDWTWAGQFGATKWYTNLNTLLPQSVIKSSLQSSAFDYQGDQVAIAYNSDLRGTYLNMTDFHKAGITAVPGNWAQLLSDAKQIKAKGILQYPIAADYSDIESTTFMWYTLIRSAGGYLLNKSGQPEFTAPSSIPGQALAYLETLYRDGLVSPGAVTWDNNVMDDDFEAGTAAVVLAESPAALPAFLTPNLSKVAKQDIVFVPTPGPKGPNRGTFALPDGMGIPAQSKHKEATAMFMEWWLQLPNQVYGYLNPSLGDLPPTSAGYSYLVKHHELAEGGTVLQLLPQGVAMFPGGAPAWYPSLSTDVSTMIQSMAEGHQTVGTGLSSLADQVHVLSGS
jgi:multiple sugar transport system substrate-binding protein